MGLIGLGLVVCLNGIAADQFCIAHPFSFSWDNPMAPAPQLPDEIVPPAVAKRGGLLVEPTMNFIWRRA